MSRGTPRHSRTEQVRSDAAAPGEASISTGSSTLGTGSSTLSAESDSPQGAHLSPEELSFAHSASAPQLASSLGSRATWAHRDAEATDWQETYRENIDESEKQEIAAELKSGMTTKELKKRRRMSCGHAKKREQRAEKEADELAEVLKCSLDFKAVQVAYESLWAVIGQLSKTVSVSESDTNKLNAGNVELNATLAQIQEAALYRHKTVKRKMATVHKLDSEIALLKKRELTMSKQLKQGEQRQRQHNAATDSMLAQIKAFQEISLRDSTEGKCVDTTGDGQMDAIQISTELATQHRIMRLWSSVVMQEAAAAKQEAFNQQLDYAEDARAQLEQELEEAKQQLQEHKLQAETERQEKEENWQRHTVDLESRLTRATVENKRLSEQLLRAAADSGQQHDNLMLKLEKKRGKLENAEITKLEAATNYETVLLELRESRQQNQALQMENQKLNRSILIFAEANEKADADVAENTVKRLKAEADLEPTKRKEADTAAELALAVQASNAKETEIKLLETQAAKLGRDAVAMLEARKLLEREKGLEIEQLKMKHESVKQECRRIAMKEKRNDDAMELSTIDTKERRGCCGMG